MLSIMISVTDNLVEIIRIILIKYISLYCIGMCIMFIHHLQRSGNRILCKIKWTGARKQRRGSGVGAGSERCTLFER